MNLRNLAIACALALAPAYAGAVSFNGSFNPGGVLDTSHDIDRNGFQGDSIVRASATDAGAPFSTTWTFTALEALRVSGEGTVRQQNFLTDLMVSFAGAPVALTPGVGGTSTYIFPLVGLMAGESVDVTVAWSDFIGGGADSSTITFDIVTAPIPLPAAGWMLIGAIGGLSLLARKRGTV